MGLVASRMGSAAAEGSPLHALPAIAAIASHADSLTRRVA